MRCNVSKARHEPLSNQFFFAVSLQEHEVTGSLVPSAFFLARENSVIFVQRLEYA